MRSEWQCVSTWTPIFNGFSDFLRFIVMLKKEQFCNLTASLFVQAVRFIKKAAYGLIATHQISALDVQNQTFIVFVAPGVVGGAL